MGRARRALRKRREQLGWTQEGIALALGVATSAYRSYESGDSTPRVGRRPKLARLLDISLAEVDRLLDDEGLGVPNPQAVPAWLGHRAALEQTASRLWAFEPFVVNGLLQTAPYAEAVERADPLPATEEGIARRVELRVLRQQVLRREPQPLQLSVVLDESVLHRVAGSPDVMATQLSHLLEVSDLPNVVLRVLPLTAGTFAASFGAFTVLGAPGTPDPYMACVEDRSGPHYLDRQPEVDAHVHLFDHLERAALPPARSVDVVHSTLKERYR